MLITIFDNDDTEVEIHQLSNTRSELGDLLRSLNGKDRVYLTYGLDGDNVLTVIGNGERCVMTYEHGGVARWLRKKDCNQGHIVEMVKDDPARVFRFNRTVSVDDAARAFEMLLDGREIPDSLYWK